MPISVVHKEMSFIGVGVVYLELIGSNTGLINIGNVSTLEYAFDEEKQEQRNFMTPGGGNANVQSSISSFTGSMTLVDYTPENLAKALRGSVTAVTAGAVTEEAHSCAGVDGELIPFDFPADHSEDITVVTTADGALVQDTDYTISSTGIVVIGTGSIDNTGVKISYTKAAGAIVEALVESGQEYKLHFDGLNDAQNGKPVAVINHRVKISPTSGLGFLNSEFAEIPISFDVISDPNVTGTGLSKYMKIVQAA
ncbi:hypothetical protein [Gilvimarinus sp. 1_MG-2023]|uniref:phage tail tube protein n=1 Tax=Gilvimarinus sp. 1_MG-2023 TaxID=3062638 RepID=UPI0026E36A9C|nr:hypothetical protein [Gilvimarinus sp. 1_MG-2023]MDO6747212.1 hypothetical protein [Gilvimarinus sp. 1_MG-2023]